MYVVTLAQIATGTSPIAQSINANYKGVTYLQNESQIPKEAKIQYVNINLQLDYWIDAKELYRKIISKNYIPTYAEFDKIILFLVTSLSKLFGRNWKKKDNLNYLMILVDMNCVN